MSGRRDTGDASPLARQVAGSINSKEKLARTENRSAGPRAVVQLRFEKGLTGEQYVNARAWRTARLGRCPNHPLGGCSLARHGTYERKTPRGARVAHWYCPESHTSFSLLPDCLAARLPGTLRALEMVVTVAERAASLADAANEIRRDAVHLPGAMRWMQRRVRLVHNALSAVIGLIPDRLAPCIPEMVPMRERVGSESALRELRSLAAPQLRLLPAPVGFHPQRLDATDRNRARQHKPGRDPPPVAASTPLIHGKRSVLP